MLSLKKIFSLLVLFASSQAYSANQHFVEFGFGAENDMPKDNMIVAFSYDAIAEKGPAAIVLNRMKGEAKSVEFLRTIFGSAISITQASVKNSFLPYQNYAVNANCKNLQLPLDANGLYITLHINVGTMSIDCTTTKIKEPAPHSS